jgi:hypothetical protein
MEQHDLEIVIAKDGRVTVRVSGAKGPACLEYARFVESLVGRVESEEKTAEFYEPPSGAAVAESLRLEERR